MKKNLVKSFCVQKSHWKNRRVKTKGIFSIKNLSLRENLVKYSWRKNPSKFELEDIDFLDEIRDYKKIIITKAHHGSKQSYLLILFSKKCVLSIFNLEK